MNKQKHIIFSTIIFLMIAGAFASRSLRIQDDQFIISYQVDLRKQDFKLYWKDDKGQIFGSIGNLENWLKNRGEKLVFAMNAGMFKPDHSPQGLFIQDYTLLANLDTALGSGNFYLKPNGVFYTTTDHHAAVCKTEDFTNRPEIKYATQSGPMLVIDTEINAAFKKGSSNVNIRNGVGILPNGQAVFAMSKQEINFYDFAAYFKELGCRNALYLDGAISRTYLPEKNWIQTDGEFGVIIGIIERL